MKTALAASWLTFLILWGITLPDLQNIILIPRYIIGDWLLAQYKLEKLQHENVMAEIAREEQVLRLRRESRDY